MSKVCLINQTAGLGDILFCQKIGVHYQKQGYRVIWPIIPQFAYLREYVENFEFPLLTEDFEYKDFYLKHNERKAQIFSDGDLLLISLHCLDGGRGIMKAKYDFVGIDWTAWSNCFELKRNSEREQRLFEYFKIQEGEKFNFVNSNFATPPNVERVDIMLQTKHRIVNMEFLDFDNVFDWCGLLERAEEIHTVNTSLCYIIEKLHTTQKLYMYKRKNYFSDWSFIQGIYNKDWRLM